jgi:hypothetical protein
MRKMRSIISKFKQAFTELDKATQQVGVAYEQSYNDVPYRIRITKLKNRRMPENNQGG